MNILINTYCNLQCPYCFADPTMKACETKNMSLMDFRFVLNFLKRNGIKEVRIIGGEPTLHPNFKEFINTVINFHYFEDLMIFSNFTFSEDIKDFLIEKSKQIKTHFLPNINEYDLILPIHRKRIEDNLEGIINNCPLANCIGINVYRPDLDLTQWEEIIKKYVPKIERLRFCVAIPSRSIFENNFDYYEYNVQFEDILWKLIEMCDKYNIFLDCDCNNLPPCCFSDALIAKMYKSDNLTPGKGPHCAYPVVDCKPDLTIAGCFGYNTHEQDDMSLKKFYTMQEVIDWCVKTGNTDDWIARKECLDCPRYKKYKMSCSCKSMHLINKNTLEKKKK